MAKGRTGKRQRESHPTAEHLPDAELEVLACLWNRGETTAAELRQQLADYRPMAHGSVLTLLNRLSQKGLVTREKSGRGKAYLYRAVPKPAPTYRRILRRLTERIFDGNPMALVATLLETYSPNQDELKQIRKLLDDLRRSDRDTGARQ